MYGSLINLSDLDRRGHRHCFLRMAFVAVAVGVGAVGGGQRFRDTQRKNRFVFRGPFLWTTAQGQTVFRVRVRDGKGNERTGWVRCGGWFWSLMSDNPEVWWDDQL